MWNGFWPLYIGALGASASQIGLVVAVRSLLGLLLVLPSGLIADRVPGPRMLAVSWLLLSLGLLLIAAARSWWQLLPVLFVLQLSRPAFPVIDREITAHSRSRPELTRAFMLIWTVGPSAVSLATPAFGGLVVSRAGLRAVFLVAAALSLVSAGLFATVQQGGAGAEDSTIDRTPPGKGTTRGAAVGSAGEGTLTYRTALRHTPIVRLLLLAGLLSLTLAVARTLLPNFLTAVHGVTLEQIGWLGSVGAVGSIGFAWLAARWRGLQRPAVLFRFALLVAALSLALFWVGGSLAVIALASLLGGGSIVAEVSLGPALAEAAPALLRQRAFALMELTRDAAYTSGPLLAGWLYERSATLPLAAGLGLIALTLAFAGSALRSSQTFEGGKRV